MVQTLLGSGVLAEVNNGNTTDISDVRGQTFTSSFNFKVLNLHLLKFDTLMHVCVVCAARTHLMYKCRIFCMATCLCEQRIP
jgi:hypothetical protein